MGKAAGFGAGLLTGILVMLFAASALMAAFIATDLDRFREWLDSQ